MYSRMTETLFGRITRSYSWCLDKNVFESWKHASVIVYEHSQDTGTSAGKTHIHFVIKDAQKRERIYEQKWWKQLALKGNEDFSFKLLDPTKDPYIYMAKGKLEPVFNTMRSLDELRQDRELWKEPGQKTVVNEITIIKKETCKITNWTIAQEAVAAWREWNLDNRVVVVSDVSIKYSMDARGKHQLIRIVSELCKKHKKGRYYRNVAQICQEALCEICPADWHDKVFSML